MKKIRCKNYYSPSCHPANILEKTPYVCIHKAFTSNRIGDYEPVVECQGDISSCELLNTKCLKNYTKGLKIRINNAEKKLSNLEMELLATEKLGG